MLSNHIAQAKELLQQLIAIPSFSREEDGTAALLFERMLAWDLNPQRTGNNVWALSQQAGPDAPTVVLVSHHDTVKPNAGYTRDPLLPSIEEGKLYGLGSNDAGGALVSLLAAYRVLVNQALKVNLAFIAAAEEEISGVNGVEAVLPLIPNPTLAIVGEPTLLQAAIAEKGLLVVDGVVKGVAGHAAREEGVNAIYLAMQDIAWFRDYRFERVSETLGPIKMQLTVLNAGQAHNSVPAECRYTVDIRMTDAYTHEEVLAIIRQHNIAEITPRSQRLKPSATPANHPIMETLHQLGIATYGSPTLSDQALIPFPSVKIGPGDSARSHTADEFIFLEEIDQAIPLYIQLIQQTYRL